MCGLVGMITPRMALDSHIKLFANMLYIDQLRGEHATGVAKVHLRDKRVEVFKKAVSATEFLGLQEAQDFLNKDRTRMYIGHNRYATVGAKDADANAHPFQHGPITLVHNGSVDRWAIDLLKGNKDLTVDSDMVCKTIAEVGIEETVKKHFSGAAAFIWWNDEDRTFNMLRNDKRTLYTATLTDGTFLWASQEEFMTVFVNNMKTLSFKDKPKMLPINKWYSWKFDDAGAMTDKGVPSVTDLPFRFIADPNPTPHYSSYTGYTGYRTTSDYGRAASDTRGTAAANYEKRVNNILKDAGLVGTLYDDEIEFSVTSIRPNVSNGAQCELTGNFEGVVVKSYSVPTHKVKDLTQVRGIISNAYTCMVGGQSFVTITIDPVTVQPIITKEEAEKLLGKNLSQTQNTTQRTTTSRGTNTLSLVHSTNHDFCRFPLRTREWTFQNTLDFVRFVKNGCSCCNEVPKTHSSLNQHLHIYWPVGAKKDTLIGAEFICGGCMHIGE